VEFFQLSFTIQFRQIGDLATVELGRGETQLFFKCLLQHLYVLVLAKNQWNDQPIVSRAHLAVGSAISLEVLMLPPRNIGERPVKFAQLLAEGRSLVVNIARGQDFSGRDRSHRSAHQNTVHDDIVADAKLARCKFVFRGNILDQSKDLVCEFDSLTRLQVSQGDQNVVTGIELEHFAGHCSE
jgi:hypothetical protein